MGGRIGGGLDRSGLGCAGRKERYRMGVSKFKCRHETAKAVTLDRTGADDAHSRLPCFGEDHVRAFFRSALSASIKRSQIIAAGRNGENIFSVANLVANLGRAPHAFTLGGCESGGDHLLNKFVMLKTRTPVIFDPPEVGPKYVSRRIDVFLGDGHCAASSSGRTSRTKCWTIGPRTMATSKAESPADKTA